MRILLLGFLVAGLAWGGGGKVALSKLKGQAGKQEVVELERRRHRVSRGVVRGGIEFGTLPVMLVTLYRAGGWVPLLIWPGSYVWGRPASSVLVPERRESLGVDCAT